MRVLHVSLVLCLSFVFLMIAACSDQVTDPVDKPVGVTGAPGDVATTTYDDFHTIGSQINSALADQGAEYRLGAIEWYTKDIGEKAHNNVFFFNVGNKRLGHHFVPNDPRRFGPGDGDEITYLIDESDGPSTVSNPLAVQAIERAMDTWRTAQCPTNLVRVPDLGGDPDYVDGFYGFGSFGTIQAQITHAGWISGVFSPGVLGVTFTFVWATINGVPTDIDNNKRLDTAFREIWYNDNWSWGIDTNIDVETVALHEAGHGLSQGHFGKLFITNANEKFHFGPRSVMNSGYTGIQQVLTGTDIAGHCANWGSWNAVPASPPPPDVSINEVFASHSGIDNQEYIELCGQPGASLNGLWVVVIEGQLPAAGRVDKAWPLAGTIPADGYYVLADDGVANQDQSIGASNSIENGTETVLLVQNLVGAQGFDVDDDNDGVADQVIGNILDGVGLVGNVADFTYYGVATVGPDGPFFPAGVARCADCAGSLSTIMCFGLTNCGSGNITPGMPNDCP